MEAQKVIITDAEKPIAVTLEDEKPRMVTKSDGSSSLEPNTTEQEDIVTAGQRKINLIWEKTQSTIALMVCGATMAAGIFQIVAEAFFSKPPGQIPTIFSVAFGTVIGFYFARTNHQAIGGIGRKADKDQAYKGR